MYPEQILDISKLSRAERRRLQRKQKKIQHPAILNLKACDVEAMKYNATEEACEKAFILMLAIPVMIMHDKFGQLMKKEGREQRFAEMILELYDTYNQGYVGLDDLRTCLEQEAGIKLTELKAKF